MFQTKSTRNQHKSVGVCLLQCLLLPAFSRVFYTGLYLVHFGLCDGGRLGQQVVYCYDSNEMEFRSHETAGKGKKSNDTRRTSLVHSSFENMYKV